MKRCAQNSLAVLVATAGLFVAAAGLARADGKLSAQRLDEVDQLGYFTPGFKQAVHDYVYTKDALAQAKVDTAKFTSELPALKATAATEQAKTAALRDELAKYDHPEEIDFTQLQSKMNDSQATLDEQFALAQAYVWTYPSSLHESAAYQLLQEVQRKQADQQTAEKNLEAQRAADHAALVKRAQNRDLSVPEWRDFLRNMSQEDLVNLMGQPTSTENDDWIYDGGWATNGTGNKIGLEISFNAGRVINVVEKPSSP